MKSIYFDMDGTIASLYTVEGWLEDLHAENTRPYEIAEPMVDMEYLNALLCEFVMLDFVIGVISWSAMNGSAEYNRAVRKAKCAWIKEYLPIASEVHVVKYGTPKHKVAKVKDGILVDDNATVRNSWKGETINANEDIISALESLLAQIEG